MIGRAFAPSHITGFFIIYDDADPMKMGSCGCGLALESGAYTETSLSNRTEIFLNGAPSEAPTTKAIIDLLTDRPVKVDSKLSLPMGGGFGASGSGALSTALALNQMLGLNRSYNDLCYAAHVAEVVNRTGLGDVAGMSSGGITIRVKPGTPFALDHIPVPPIDIYCVHFGPISTKSVLSDEKEKACINKAGTDCLKELLRKPTFGHFMELSRKFSVSTGLVSAKGLDAIESVESHGGMASMAMLGDTIFSTCEEGMSEFGEVIRTKICMTGAYPLL